MIKLKTAVSNKWLPAEREALVRELSEKLDSLLETHAGDALKGPRYVVFDAQERLDFLKTRPASFLEANRDCILNGNQPPRSR